MGVAPFSSQGALKSPWALGFIAISVLPVLFTVIAMYLLVLLVLPGFGKGEQDTHRGRDTSIPRHRLQRRTRQKSGTRFPTRRRISIHRHQHTLGQGDVDALNRVGEVFGVDQFNHPFTIPSALGDCRDQPRRPLRRG